MTGEMCHRKFTNITTSAKSREGSEHFVVLTLWSSKASIRKGCCLHSNIFIKSSRWMIMSPSLLSFFSEHILQWSGQRQLLYKPNMALEKIGHKNFSRGRKTLIRSFTHFYIHVFHCHVWRLAKNVFNSRRLEITNWITCLPPTCPLIVLGSLPLTPCHALFHQGRLRAQCWVPQLDQRGSQHCTTLTQGWVSLKQHSYQK